MKRLLIALLCIGALSPLASGLTKVSNATAQQEQKETKSYDEYVGEYEVQKGFVLTITNENGKLMGQPTGDVKLEFKAEKEVDQFMSADKVHLKFVRDATGVVTGVVVSFDSKDFQAKKIK